MHTPKGGYHPYVAEEKTEVQRGQDTGPGSQSRATAEPGSLEAELQMCLRSTHVTLPCYDPDPRPSDLTHTSFICKAIAPSAHHQDTHAFMRNSSFYKNGEVRGGCLTVLRP